MVIYLKNVFKDKKSPKIIRASMFTNALLIT